MRYKALLFRISFIITLAVISSCSKDSAGPSKSVLMPLKTGNFWVYRDSWGTVGEPTEGTSFDTILVTGTIMIGSNQYFKVGQPHDDEFTLVRNTAAGLEIKYYDDGIIEDGMLYKYPIADGDSYTQSWEGDLVSVTAWREATVSPAGTFDCFVYEWTHANWGNEYGNTESFAPDVGFVYGMWTDQSEYGNTAYYTQELISYSLK